MRIAVIADDFTGANDVGIQLNRYGLNVVTAIEEISEADVVIESSESRNIDEEEAKNRVAIKFKEMKNRGFDYFYKKIDSTLRGNILKEVEAIIENIDSREKIVVAIAFPLIGRVIKNGEHFFNGKRLIETEVAKDPITPVKEGDLKKIFENSVCISIDDINREIALQKIEKSGKQIVIFDSETEEELKRVAEFLVKEKFDRYIVGSAGIMNYLPEFWGVKNRTVVVSGSCSSISINQIDKLIEEKEDKLHIVELDIINRTEENKNYITTEDIVIRSIIKRKEIEEVMSKFQSEGISRARAGDIISDYIANESIKYIEANKAKNIIILGGETSYKILKKLKIKGLKIEFEIETGIAVAKSENMRYNIIVKPGNFGSEKCISRCYDILKNRKI